MYASRRSTHRRVARAAAVFALSLLTLLGAVWAAPRTSQAVDTWMRTPPLETRLLHVAKGLPVAAEAPQRTRSSEPSPTAASWSAAPVTLDAGMRFTMVGLLCAVPGAEGGVDVRVRTSLDGHEWSRWYVSALEVASDGSGAPRAFTEPLWTGDGRYVQVSAVASGAGAPVELRGVELMAINSTEAAAPVARATGVVRRAAAAVAGVDLTPPAAAAVPTPNWVTRAGWGADESLRSGTPAKATVKMAFVHHTAGGNTYSQADAPAVVRGIYAYHTLGLKWSDIGYNFLIDRFGTVYVGRYGGPRQGVVGAQVYGFNTGSTGVSVMGTYTSIEPPAVALASLHQLMAWKLELHGLDPMGKAKMTCGATDRFTKGQTVTLPVIAGHRDANYTACPGNRLYAGLAAVRQAAAGLITPPKITDFKVTVNAISPNGDGVQDRLTVSYRISEKAAWAVEVVAAAGDVVRRRSGEGDTVKIDWAGKADDGSTVPDGAYTLRVSATSAYGAVRTKAAQVVVDTVAPKLAPLGVAPAAFSPNGDGWQDRCALTFTPSEPCSMRVTALDAAGVARRQVWSWRSVAAGAQKLTWAGKIERDGKLVVGPEGSYTLLAELRDAAGNVNEQRREVAVDRTLGFAQPAPAAFSPNGDGIRESVALAFRLTRKASVTVAVTRGGDTLRTFKLGELAAGARKVTWNGKVAGKVAAAGRYRFTVTAESAAGVITATAPLDVDLARPRLTASATVAVARGVKAKVGVAVADADSAQVDLWCRVTDARGRVVTTVRRGLVGGARTTNVSWKPPARGVYTLTFRARDPGGNREQAPARTTLTVR